MKSFLRKSVVAGFAAVAILLAAVGSAAAGGGCLSPGQAQRALASGAILRLGVIVRAVGGEVINAQLCDSGGLLVYRLAVMRPDGRIENIVVDATSGQRLR